MNVTKSDPLRKIFLGEQGLRAGWSALIFIAIFVALGVVGGALVRRIIPMGNPQVESPNTGILREGVEVVALFIATWIMARIEKRPVLSYGFRDSRMLKRFISGLLVGVLSMSAVVGLLWASHLLVFDGQLLSGGAIWGYAALWALMYFIIAVFEEGLFRSYLQYTFARGLNFWWAALIVSILFGAAHGHNQGESPLGHISAVVASLVLCLSLWLTGSLWWAIGMHMGLGWAESYLYGVSNSGTVSEGRLLATHPVGSALMSGGTTGPEGSVYTLLMLLVMAAGLWLTWGRKRKAWSGLPT